MKPVFGLILVFFIIFTGCGDNENKLTGLERGDLAFSRRQYLKAANIYKKEYNKAPHQAVLLRRLTDCFLKLGRIERAISFCEKAVEANPENIEDQIKLARLYILVKDFSMAHKVTRTLKEKGIAHPDLDLINADLCVFENKHEQAEMFYRHAVITSNDSLKALMKLAVYLKSSGRNEEATELYNIVKNSSIELPQIHLLISDYLLIDENTQQAEDAILRAIRIEPEEPGLYYHLVQFYISTGQHDKARKILTGMLEKQDDLHLWMTLADIHISKLELAEAEHIINRLKENIKEKIPAFELLQGKYWLMSQKPFFATSHLKSALEIRPELVNTRYLLSMTHILNNKIKLSENNLIKTLQIQPEHRDALILMSALLYKKKEYRLAINYLDRFQKIYPEEYSGYLLKGINLLSLNSHEDAKKEIQKALFLSPAPLIPQYYMGLIHESQQQYPEALYFYKNVIDKHPDMVHICYRYGLMLLKIGKTRELENFIVSKMALSSKTPFFYQMAAKLAFKMGKPDQEEQWLTQAVELKECPESIFLELADLYQRKKQFSNSIKILNQCIDRYPGFMDGWITLSSYYLESGDSKTALEILEKGYSKFKTEPLFQSNLAWLLLENNQDLSRALSLAQTAYEKQPDNIAYADTLAWAYYHKGIYSQALWLLSEIERKVPDNGFVQFHLGMTYYHSNNFEKAGYHLTKATQMDISNTDSKKAGEIILKIQDSKKISSGDDLSLEPESIISFPDDTNEDDQESETLPLLLQQ